MLVSSKTWGDGLSDRIVSAVFGASLWENALGYTALQAPRPIGSFLDNAAAACRTKDMAIDQLRRISMIGGGSSSWLDLVISVERWVALQERHWWLMLRRGRWLSLEPQ